MAYPFQHRSGLLKSHLPAEEPSKAAADVPNREGRTHKPGRRARGLLIACILVLAMGTAAVMATQTVWFKDWLRGYIVREANNYLNGQLSIGKLGGNLFSGIEMENIELSLGGRPVLSVKDLGVEYSVVEIVSKGIEIRRIRLNQPTFYLWREGDGWAISRAVKAQRQEADRTVGRPCARRDWHFERLGHHRR